MKLKLAIRPLSEVGPVASKLAWAGAVLAVSLEFAIIARQGPVYIFRETSIPDTGVGLFGSSIMLYGLLFLFAIYPRFKAKAVWVLGLMWGLAEGVWNIETTILRPSTLAADFSSFEWWVYMLTVGALFCVSLYALRKDLKMRPPTIYLTAGVLLFTFVYVLLEAQVPGVLPYLSSPDFTRQVIFDQLPYHAMIIGDVWLLLTARDA